MDSFVFIGNDNISLKFLEKIIDKKRPEYIITGHDRISGRGRKLTPSPLVEIAKKNSIELLKTDNPNSKDFLKLLREKKIPDFFLLFSFGYILNKEFLEIPKRMSVNIHPSLLPKYRGAAPINRVIINGEKRSGVTFFKMDETLDGGDIIFQEDFGLEPYIDSIELKEKVIEVSSKMFLIFDWSHDFKLYKQDESQATYAKKIKKEELVLDLNKNPLNLTNHINGLAEYGIKCRIGKYNVKIRKVVPSEIKVEKGNLKISEKKELLLGCDDGSVSVLKIQPEGKNIMDSKSFINGYKIKDGEKICVESLES
ncbi:MAG: methionyl-tRNA formyltransferase [candidate division WOR-3 bacterium]